MRTPIKTPRVTSPKDDGAFVERPWGGYQTLDEGEGYKVKRLVVKPGRRLSLQQHRFRAEHWVIIAGKPRIIVHDRARRLGVRETVDVPKGAWHRIENPGRTQVVIIEVQHGPYLVEDVIIRREDDYGRAGKPPAISTSRKKRPT